MVELKVKGGRLMQNRLYFYLLFQKQIDRTKDMQAIDLMNETVFNA